MARCQIVSGIKAEIQVRRDQGLYLYLIQRKKEKLKIQGKERFQTGDCWGRTQPR